MIFCHLVYAEREHEANKETIYGRTGRSLLLPSFWPYALSIPLIIMIGFPAAALLAFLYAYIVVYCPVIGHVNILFLAGYVVGTGWVISKLASVGK